MFIRFKKAISLILIAALSAATLCGCGGQNTEDEREEIPENVEISGEEISYYAADDVFSLNCNRSESFNPLVTRNLPNLLVSQLMYDNMYEVDETYTAVPNIIESSRTEDGKGWMFIVDTDRTFWDGSQVTASDVAYSIARAMRSPQYSDRLKVIMGVSAMDVESVAINLYYADMQLPTLLSIPVIKNGTNDELAPMGTGKYAINSEKTELNAVDPNAGLPVDTIYLKEFTDVADILGAYKDSTIDLVTNDPNGIMSLGYGSLNEIRYYQSTCMHYLGFNAYSRFFSVPEARGAMNYVVNREEIALDIMDGMITPSPLPINPASALFNEKFSELFAYSQSRSEAAFEKANVKDFDEDDLCEIEVTGIPIEIEIDFIVCSDNSKKVAAAESIANNLTELGITVNLRELPFDTFRSELQNGNFDMYYAETMLTPDFNLRPLLIFDQNLNYGQMADTVLEEKIYEYLAADDESRQMQADLLYKYIADTGPIITIGFEKKQVVTHSNAIAGIDPLQYNIFNDFENWEFKD